MTQTAPPHPPLRSATQPGDSLRQWLTLALAAAQVGAIIWQFVGSSGGADLSLARRSDPPIVPAGYTFAVWGPIYLGCFAYAAYQLRPDQAARPLHRRVGPWAASAFGAATLWALAAGFPPPLASWGTVAMIFVMFGTLSVALLRASSDAQRVQDRRWVVAPLGLYAGYVTLATIANTAASLWHTGIRAPLGLGETPWTVLMLGAAGVVASVVIRRTRAPVAYSAAVVWGLLGIVVQNTFIAPRPVTAGAALAAAAGTALLSWRTRRRQAPPAPLTVP